MSINRILFVLGTRPEFLKMYPVICALRDDFDVMVCNTGQHCELVDSLVECFGLKIDYSLHVMSENQSLPGLSSKLMDRLDSVIKEADPDLVFVQGDTATAFFGALSAYYNKIPVAHIEAGLRSGDIYSPFPEEAYRKFISQISSYNFVPTEKDAINVKNPIVVGNTIVDMLEMFKRTVLKDYRNARLECKNRKSILVTIHRRENHEKIGKYCSQIREICEMGYKIYFVLHPNPNVRDKVLKYMSGNRSISIISALPYIDMLYLISRCHIILSDSGGIQEEAPSFGKPVIILRDTTERPAAVELGFSFLLGKDIGSLPGLVKKISESYEEIVDRMYNPYGDGMSSIRICNTIRSLV